MNGIFVHNIRNLEDGVIAGWMARCVNYFQTEQDPDILDASSRTYNALEEELIRRGYYKNPNNSL